MSEDDLEDRRVHLEAWIQAVVAKRESDSGDLQPDIAAARPHILRFLSTPLPSDKEIPPAPPARPTSSPVSLHISKTEHARRSSNARILPAGLVPFVIDNGSRSIKAGAAVSSAADLDAEPTTVIPTLIGRQTNGALYIGTETSKQPSLVIGSEAEAMGPLLSMHSPVFMDPRKCEF